MLLNLTKTSNITIITIWNTKSHYFTCKHFVEANYEKKNWANKQNYRIFLQRYRNKIFQFKNGLSWPTWNCNQQDTGQHTLFSMVRNSYCSCTPLLLLNIFNWLLIMLVDTFRNWLVFKDNLNIFVWINS